MKKFILIPVAIIALGGIAYLSLLFFHLDIVFQGTKLPKDYSFEFDESFDEYFVTSGPNDSLNALLFSSGDSPKGLIIYFHGNADNLQRWGTYLVDFTRLGYDVLAIDYSGYGKSTGEPTEDQIYKDAETIWYWAQDNFQYQIHIIYGRSLGSAPACFLASQHDVDLLILETPFNRLTQDIPKMFIPEELGSMFVNEKYVPLVKCKIVIIHGNEDSITRLSATEKLIPFLKKEDEFIIIEGGSHKNLREFPEYHQALEHLL